MIIQKIIKGICVNKKEADGILSEGILSNWWRNTGPPSRTAIVERLTEENLDWHQNHFDDPDPNPAFAGSDFSKHTPFISTTAGCVERDSFARTNQQHRAWFEALRFATEFWTKDGYLFYGYLFVLGKKSISFEQFSEELRELNIYQDYSNYHPEGEVTAKIVIPSVQIEKWEHYEISGLAQRIADETAQSSATVQENILFIPPDYISNIRELI